MTTIRQTKACPIERTITVTAENDFGRTVYATVCETKHLKTKTTCTSDVYTLERIPTHLGGVAIEVVKAGSTSEGECYAVLLNGPGGSHSCNCPHGTYRGQQKPCRHVLAALEARQQGLI